MVGDGTGGLPASGPSGPFGRSPGRLLHNYLCNQSYCTIIKANKRLYYYYYTLAVRPLSPNMH